MKKFIPLIALALASQSAHALRIDKMLTTSDEKGNGYFTLVNELAQTSFITAQIDKVNVVNGELVKEPYTENNLKDWDITVTAPKLILESGRVRQVGVRSLCASNCQFEQDRVYQITFSPVPYVAEGEEPAEGGALNINFGYSPYFIIPAKESDVGYKMTYDGKSIHATNTGNTYVRFMVSQCTSNTQTECSATYTLLSGRTLTIDLPEKLRQDTLNLMVVNHDESYRQRQSLSRTKPIQE